MSESELPVEDFGISLIPGNVKVVKNANRRSDAMYFIDPASIHIKADYNVRIEWTESHKAHIRALADSMKRDGFHADSPLAVYVAKHGEENRVYLIRGHCRLQALKLANEEGAGITEVPVIFKPKCISTDELDDDLIDSNNGRNLSTAEQALWVKKKLNNHFTSAQILATKRFSAPQLTLLTILGTAPKRLFDMVASGEASAKVVVDLLNKHGGPEAQRRAIEMVERAKNAGYKQLTVRNLPQAAFKKALKKAAPKLHAATAAVTSDPGYAALAPQTRELLESVLGELKQSEAA